MEINPDILARIKTRQIAWLTHFTRIENVPSIIRLGLQPRNKFNVHEVRAPMINDLERRDGYPAGICLSIQHPNIALLKRWMIDQGGDWCVLLIDPTILALQTLRKKFFAGNAASSIKTEINPNFEPTVNDFEELFRDRGYERLLKMAEACSITADMTNMSKQARGWKSSEPDHVQAEVMVFDAIPAKHVKAIAVQTESIRDHLASSLDSLDQSGWHERIKVCNDFFTDKCRR